MLSLVRSYAARPADEWKPLFYRILDNRILDMQRRRTVRGRVMSLLPFGARDRDGAVEGEEDPIEQAPSPVAAPLEQLEMEEAIGALESAIAALPDRQRQCFLLRNFEAGDMRMPALIEPLEGSGSKVDWNNMHAVGTDHPGANYEYPEASYERRVEIENQHKTYILGFLWTMANNPRVPEDIRKRAATYGLPKDEFTDNGGWPWMIYIREARRMIGDYVMTQHDCEGTKSAPDPVALGSFGMDSHCVQHFVTGKGTVQNEGVIWRVPPKPYGISYRSVIPKVGECENLFVPICLSTSHVAHGSIRMEPVFMALSQSCAVAASLAIGENVPVQKIAYPALAEKLLAAGQVIRYPHNPRSIAVEREKATP